MADDLHGWGPALDEIGRRKAEALAMGGQARLDRQRERGRLNARERLEVRVCQRLQRRIPKRAMGEEAPEPEWSPIASSRTPTAIPR